MNRRLYIQLVYFTVALWATILPYASANAQEVPIKVQPHKVYHVIKDKTLLQASDQIAQRSGIVFKINVANQKDIINKTLAADDWQSALPQFLDTFLPLPA